MCSIRPRRAVTSPITSPMNSSGVVTSNSITGSSRTGSARRAASFTTMEPAILNAISDESTSWKEPSMSVARTSTMG